MKLHFNKASKLGGLTLFFCLRALSAPTDMTLQGSLDVRPSWTTSKGTFHTEDEVEAFLRIQGASGAGYVQEFQTNLSNAGEGLGLETVDGYLKGRLELSRRFELEQRVIFPTSAYERQAGLNIGFKSIVKWKEKLLSGWEFEFWESPILPLYSKAGFEQDGVLEANRLFENRMDWILSRTFFNEALTFSFSLVWQQIRYRQFEEGAHNHAVWNSLLWVSPEIIYSIAQNTGIGIAYYSENFVGEGNSFSEGLRRGVTQAIFQQSF